LYILTSLSIFDISNDVIHDFGKGELDTMASMHWLEAYRPTALTV